MDVEEKGQVWVGGEMIATNVPQIVV